MTCYNKTLLMGRLVQDAEAKTTPGGMDITEFTIAVETKFSEDKREVAFLDCTLFGERGPKLIQYLVKGKNVFVEGRLRQEKWESKVDGKKKSKITIIVENVEFL